MSMYAIPYSLKLPVELVYVTGLHYMKMKSVMMLVGRTPTKNYVWYVRSPTGLEITSLVIVAWKSWAIIEWKKKKIKGCSHLAGLEPATFRLTAERANRLRHRCSAVTYEHVHCMQLHIHWSCLLNLCTSLDCTTWSWKVSWCIYASLVGKGLRWLR